MTAAWTQLAPQEGYHGLTPHQLATLREVEAMRVDCMHGRRAAVLIALDKCFVARLNPPQWLTDMYGAGVVALTSAEVGSLDEAFGRFWKKGTRLEIERQHSQMADTVYRELWKLAREEPGLSADGRCKRVGEKVGKSGRTVARIYSKALGQGRVSLRYAGDP